LFRYYQTVRKIIVGVLGFSVLLIGALMIVLPGPAIVVIPAGLAILATEFTWARIMLLRLKKKLPWRANGNRERSHGA
jgi:tellurite resistance protein TerC